jgi:hypothetical protein
MPADTPPAHPTRSPIFGTAFRSPATAASLDASIPGSKLPACSFRSRPASFRPVRPFGSTAPTSSPRPLPLLRLGPVSGSPPVDADLLRRLHSPSGLLHPSGSTCSTTVRSTDPLAGHARFPFAPRCRRLLDYRLRIIVPESLRFRRNAWSAPQDRLFATPRPSAVLAGLLAVLRHHGSLRPLPGPVRGNVFPTRPSLCR